MHGDDRAAVMPGTVLQLFFQKTEIRDRVGVVVFDRIGVKANEFDVPDDKGKVFSPKQFIENPAITAARSSPCMHVPEVNSLIIT